MRQEFKTIQLNDAGHAKLNQLAEKLSEALAIAEGMVPAGRERAIGVTKLQEAFAFWRAGIEAQKAYQKESE